MKTQELKYYTIPTTYGLDKIERYNREKKTVQLSHMGFGGINGNEESYIKPNPDALSVPNEWERIPLERRPEDGFTGGGATINNAIAKYKGKWICNIGIYDTDGDLILIAAYRPLLVDPEDAIVSSYPINIRVVLANAEHVVVYTDTSITHPTISDMEHALRTLYVELSKYATTDKKGLMEIATLSEVRDGADSKRAIVPSTLKPIIDDVIQLINNTESTLNQPATTNRLGLAELATQAEVDNKTGKDQVVTVETLDKPSLITSLQQFATDKANRVKEELFGGLPSATLDTFVEVGNALQETGDAVATLFEKISEKLSIATFNEYRNTVSIALNSKLDKTGKAADSSKLDGKTKSQVIAEAQSGLATVTSVNDHINNKNNPHDVNKHDIELGNVPNYTITASTTDPSDNKFATAGAVSRVKALADSKLGKWRQVATGVHRVPARNGRNVYVGTVNTGYKGGGSYFDADRFRVYYRGYSVESGNPSACYWEVRCEIKSRLYYNSGGVICFDIYTGGDHIVSGYAGETWRLYELDA